MGNKQSQLAIATLLHNKLKENVAHITWPLTVLTSKLLHKII